MKKKLIISNAQCMYRVSSEDIVYIEADGNYSHLCLAGGNDVVLTIQIGKLAELIDRQLDAESCPLAKLGRSLIVNLDYVYFINPQKQQLILKDATGQQSKVLSAPVNVLRGLKMAFDKEGG